MLQNIAVLLHRYGNDKSVSNWTMDIQSRVQAAFLEKSSNSEFLMDLFTLCIVVSSGCSTLFGNVDVVATCRQSRLDVFPAAVHILSERAFWRDCTVRVSRIEDHTSITSCSKNSISFFLVYRFLSFCSTSSPTIQIFKVASLIHLKMHSFVRKMIFISHKKITG